MSSLKEGEGRLNLLIEIAEAWFDNRFNRTLIQTLHIYGASILP